MPEMSTVLGPVVVIPPLLVLIGPSNHLTHASHQFVQNNIHKVQEGVQILLNLIQA